MHQKPRIKVLNYASRTLIFHDLGINIIIQNSKMYEKLNVEKADQMSTGMRNTKWTQRR